MPKFFSIALFALLILTASRAHAAPNANYSLRFYGNGVNDIDRVKIRLDAPARPVDVGGSFTLEFWLKANAGENTAQVSCDVNDGWITGNIIFDRDVYGAGDYGDYGIALTEGRIAFGVSRGNEGNTLCGATNVADGAWHHIAVTRHKKSGALKIFVDGALDASGAGAPGNISYRDGRATDYPNSDPYLVIGAEKHDAGSAYPSYSGFIDEVRISRGLRYKTNFARPTQPFVTDAQTLGLYHFDKGAGNKIKDSSGALGGPSNGKRKFGGTPAGPVWSSDTPF
ncbi:LamG domain-containing protein [Anaerolineae bacterium CFX7]|nr:LamG domain-containing protein [Anaerolineae bacterium CFX7]